MTEVRVLDAAPPNPGVVEALEDILARAKAGDLSSVAIAVVYRDGSTGDAWSEPASIGTLIGAVTILQHRLCGTLDTHETTP